MKYAFMTAHKDDHAINVMSRAFAVSTSGYYAWRKRPQSHRDRANQELDAKINAIFKLHKGRYGSPRITDELRDQGTSSSSTYESLGNKGGSGEEIQGDHQLGTQSSSSAKFD